MSDISSQLIKDSYNYILQSDLSTGVVYRIGGDIPVNPIFISGLTITDGLTSDTISATTYYNLPFNGDDYLSLSGGTISGATNFTNGLTANTISATTVNITDSLTINNVNITSIIVAMSIALS
jgi:hypothetical protein